MSTEWTNHSACGCAVTFLRRGTLSYSAGNAVDLTQKHKSGFKLVARRFAWLLTAFFQMSTLLPLIKHLAK